MTLSSLVHYLNQLDTIDATQLHANAKHGIDHMLHVVSNHAEVRWPDLDRTLFANARHMDQLFSELGVNLNALRQHARNLIQEQEADLYRESTRVWQHEAVRNSVEYLLSRELASGPDTNELILGKVLNWSDWRFPGLIIGPKKQSWIDHLVALDPLYIIDDHPDLLTPAQTRYPTKYQQRLRLYTINERNNQPILTALPSGQFGMVFAYDFFNYRPFELVCRWVSEIFVLLKPGGTMFITFNDCDYSHGVALAEKNFMTYVPGQRLVRHLQEVGFEIVERRRGESDVAWIQARRPGELTTMRAGQNLAKIVARSK